MLVCPQCGFENPNTNKFCQECGTALTQNACPECNSMVPFDSVRCHECGAIAGVIWWAIITEDPECSSRASDVSSKELTFGSIASDPSIVNETGHIDTYLDLQQRYLLLESLPPLSVGVRERQVRVLDCQPFQLSPLEALAAQESELPTADLRDLGHASASVNPSESEAGATVGVSSGKVLGIPGMAQPYLALRTQFHQTLPGIHDAWQRDGQQFVLLEDRSQLPLLMELWHDPDLPLPPLQVLHWLYEMSGLWQELSFWNCQQSLLEITNLRVDEDQALCLQRLYTNSAESSPVLKDLGQLWRTLFNQSQRTQFASISLLLADLELGKVVAPDALRSRIEEIAHELQLTHSMTEDFSEAHETRSELPMTAPVEAGTSAHSSLIDPDSSIAATQLEASAQGRQSSYEEEGEGDNEPTVVLPMQLFSLEDVGRTDIGRQRHHNEDYFGIETQVTKLESPSGKTVHVRNLYVLCDGMGGQADGEVASALAVDTLRRYFKDRWQSAPFVEGQNQLPGPDVLAEAVQLANKAIYDVNQQNARSGSGRMGTTLVMALIQDTEAAIAHVGDSRLYRYTRKRGLEQLTVDHEVGQREIQRGVDPEIAYARPDAYQLTQALGPRDEHFVKPDIQYLELNEDVLLLLCSDGLTDNQLLETHCQTHIEPLLSSQTQLEQGVNRLVDLANQYNGHDNITAIAIRAKVRPNLAHLR